jgi:hypothetical protein
MLSSTEDKPMNEDVDVPTLHFFRATPPDLPQHPPLASSLQAFETCLFLIGLNRYPSALISCATAWESVLKAKLAIPAERNSKLVVLLDKARAQYPPLRAFDRSKLDRFREERNHLVHSGFSPKDDEECSILLLETGFPFLSLCYQVLFDFYLDWRDIRPGSGIFTSLTPEELDTVGLIPEVAEQLRIAGEVYRRSKSIQGQKHLYCFSALSHYIRLSLKESAMTESEWNIIENADSLGTKFNEEHKFKEEVRRVFDAAWDFDCPFCAGNQSLVTELETEKLKAAVVATTRCACVQCGFIVGKQAPYLAEVLLAEQITKNRARILKEYGIQF